MDESFVSSLALEGTPECRSEKSSYLRRKATKNSASIGLPNTSLYASPRVRKPAESTFANVSLSAYSVNYESQYLMDSSDDIQLLLNAESGNLTSDLYQEFLDFYHSYPGEHEIFDLLLQYEDLCLSSAKALQPLLQKSAPGQQKYAVLSTKIEEFRHERNTWRLLRTLYQDRIDNANINEEEILMDTVDRRMSDKQLIENFFMRDSCVRQCQLVVDCLEKNAADDFVDEYRDKVQHFSDQSTISWEHTLHDLKMRTPLNRPTRDSLITELDPDAPIRQRNNILHSEDKEVEDRLLKHMFLFLRCGNLDEAQKMAESYGYPWLAASLEGWRLFHDPNYDNDTLVEGDVLQPVEGNKYRDIWKAACWRMSQEPRIPMYQQALFGCLSGNLEAVLRACRNWNDCLWAYSRVLVDKLTEQELRSNTQCTRILEELPNEYWEKIPNFEEIFQELQAREGISKEGKGFHAVIQKYIILDDIDGLIEVMHSWSQRKDTSPNHGHLLRVMAHLVLFFRTIGRSTKEDLCVSILEMYVKELIVQRKIPLIASYTATLPPAHQVLWYANFLEGIKDETERKLCLKYAEDAGLDIPAITKTVVVNVRTRMPESETLSVALTTEEMTPDDKSKISALGWLFFDPMQRSEALKQANALLRVFVACEKLDAAREVMSKIPADSVNLINQTKKGEKGLPAEDENAIREYLCFKAYLEALDAFSDWFKHFQNSRPVRPEQPDEDIELPFKQKVAFDHLMEQYQQEMERWEKAMMAQTKTTTDRLYNVLIFVGGGWMVDQHTEDPVDEGRQKQLAALRKLCIPKVTKLLHNVLHNTRQYMKSLQLADLIACEQYQLYNEFSVQELRDLLSLFNESSICVLGENQDPLGYPVE